MFDKSVQHRKEIESNQTSIINLSMNLIEENWILLPLMFNCQARDNDS
jgi:hypothetical protein